MALFPATQEPYSIAISIKSTVAKTCVLPQTYQYEDDIRMCPQTLLCVLETFNDVDFASLCMLQVMCQNSESQLEHTCKQLSTTKGKSRTNSVNLQRGVTRGEVTT